MKKQLQPILTYAKIDIRRLFRDKVAIFFIFVFPLIFLLVFGSLFGRDDVSFNLAFINKSDSQFATEFEQQIRDNDIFSIDEDVANIGDAEERMSRGEVDATIILPDDFGDISEGIPRGQAQVVYDRGNEQGGITLGSILESIFADINAGLVPVDEPFTLQVQPTEAEGLSGLDFLFSGLLGFSILSLGVFGPTTVFPRLKERGILRRYHTTPIRVWQYFAGNVISNSFVGILAVAFMFIAAMLIFDVSMRGDYLSLVLLTVLGTVVMFGVGLAAGGWAKNENQAAPLANLIAFPMMFLSGVFFPRFLMPDWLASITQFLPLTPFIDGLRQIITEGQTILQIGTEVGLLAAWVVVIYAIAFWVFRWE
ncbi:MAG: ABC transporter permease [Candidatus Saccharibacteria bacterium]|nr:ABC transporter permease [Candidatus Saccharibacteria bacterium]